MVGLEKSRFLFGVHANFDKSVQGAVRVMKTQLQLSKASFS